MSVSDQQAADVESWSSPFTQVEMHGLWTYSDGALTAKGYRLPSGAARAGSWVLVDEATGNLQGLIPPGILTSVPAGGPVRRCTRFSHLSGDR